MFNNPRVKIRERQIYFEGSIGITSGKKYSLIDIVSFIFPSLYIGCALDSESIPEILQVLSKGGTFLDTTGEINEALISASQRGEEGGMVRELLTTENEVRKTLTTGEEIWPF